MPWPWVGVPPDRSAVSLRFHPATGAAFFHIKTLIRNRQIASTKSCTFALFLFGPA
jgi:hypothetical protein